MPEAVATPAWVASRDSSRRFGSARDWRCIESEVRRRPGFRWFPSLLAVVWLERGVSVGHAASRLICVGSLCPAAGAFRRRSSCAGRAAA